MRMRVFSVLLVLIFGVIGCAMLQEAPLVEIPASRLTCDQTPEMVDGDLETAGTFKTKGSVQKGFGVITGNLWHLSIDNSKYQRVVKGSIKTETLIKLDTPTYIKYVEVYPASTIRNLALDVGIKPPNRKLSFEAVEDKRSIKVEGTLPVRFQIGREILYLQLTANALEDLDNVSHGDEYGEMQIPLKGASIREVKFYGRQPL
jgi:hypothetical protein